MARLRTERTKAVAGMHAKEDRTLKTTLTATKSVHVEEEERGEEQPRSWSADKSAKEETPVGNALPYLTASGRWRAAAHSIKIPGVVDPVEHVDGRGESDNEEDDGQASVASSLSDEADANVPSFEQIRLELATLAIGLTEETQGNLGSLKEMLKYTDSRRYNVPTVQLALLSSLAVFKDIMPGYHIRPLGEAEKQVTVSKDVKQTREFEQAILANYRRFIETLKTLVAPPKRRRLPSRLLPALRAALTCVHELALSAAHFNHYEDVLRLLMQSLLLPWEDEVQRSCDALQRVFAADEQGQATMLALRLLSSMIQDRQYCCPPNWLEALQTVRIRTITVSRRSAASRDAPQAQSGGKKKFMSKRERKDLKAQRQELAKLAEAEEVVSQEELGKWSAESLKHLFRIYFGVLKHAPTAERLPPILAGLARHSHRIGLEYFTDLLQALRRLLEERNSGGVSSAEAPALDLIPALHCILTIDKIYSINENLAAMDLKFFYNALYRQLGRLAQQPRQWEWDRVQDPLQGCLANLFHPKRHLPAPRVAAFTQRLGDLALALQGAELPGPTAFAIEHIKTILTHHPRAAGVLDQEPFGQGAYLVTCDDPDLCNPYSRSLYHILRQCQSRERQQAPGTTGKIASLVQAVLRLAPQP